MNPSMLIVLLLLSLLATFIGNLMILVAAFRQSILWGLASLFVPFAQLFFMLRHWDAARKGFLLGLGGAALMVFALFSMPDRAQYLGRFLPESYTNSWGAPSASQTAQIKELTEKIQQQREHILKLEGEFSQATTALASQYQAITDKRKALKSDDSAAVNQFNEDAAAYHQLNNRVKQMPQDLKTAKQELDNLLNERSKRQSAAKATSAPEIPPEAPSAKGSSPITKDVVMYTITRCSACTMAKQYLAKKGVAYREMNVQTSSTAKEEFARLGGRGVPVIIIGDKRLAPGFDQQAIDQALQ